MKETIYSKFKEQVKRQPEGVAVMDERRTLTYNELDALAATIELYFPVSAPGMVGVVMDHGVEQIASLIAVLKAGAAYVPVEPSFPDERIDFVMNETNVDFVITNSRYANRFKKRETVVVDPGMAIRVAANDIDNSQPDGAAYVLYTSGSTGLPKGVVVENRNVCHYISAFEREFNAGPGDVIMQHSVCSFDIFTEEVYGALLNGATLAIPTDDTKADIHKLMEYTERYGVTIISGFPYLLLEMNKLPEIPSTIRLLISGGDVLRESYVNRLLPHTTIYNTYGPSETTVCATYFRCNGAKAQPDGTYPIGTPLPGTQIAVCDANMRPVQQGMSGEICIAGDGVSRGYIGNREVENRAFVTTSDGRRIYRSGDIGRMLPDGSLLFHNRKDSQVMIMGRRVETCEVENVLCQCPDVETGVVSANIDDAGLHYLTAYVVPKEGAPFSLRRLRAQMARFLPEYMIPEYFVTLNAIPLTPNGKVNSGELPVVMKINEL